MYEFKLYQVCYYGFELFFINMFFDFKKKNLFLLILNWFILNIFIRKIIISSINRFLFLIYLSIDFIAKRNINIFNFLFAFSWLLYWQSIPFLPFFRNRLPIQILQRTSIIRHKVIFKIFNLIRLYQPHLRIVWYNLFQLIFYISSHELILYTLLCIYLVMIG